jgi:hypothetical protein
LGDIIPLPATQGLPAEVPAGGRPRLVDGAGPLHAAVAVRRLLLQVPAWCVDKEITVRFLEPPLPEVMQLVGFALPDDRKRQPPAALTATAAEAGCRDWL